MTGAARRPPPDPLVTVRIVTLICVASAGMIGTLSLGAQLLLERAHARHLARARIAVEQPR